MSNDDNGKVNDGMTGATRETFPSLKTIVPRVLSLVRERPPQTIDQISPDLHPLPPFLPKHEWTLLGDAIRVAEQQPLQRIPGDKWISLRCDGSGFSKLTRYLQRQGVLSTGYSTEFASLMQASCRELMTKFAAVCGYTQSDEITVLLAPMPIVRGEQQPHAYNGRLAKLCSLAAATVTARFLAELSALCQRKQICTASILLSSCLPTFDCRVGVYDTREEALSVVLWRAYDCAINAVSDAVYKSGLAQPGEGIMRKSSDHKLQWLKKKNLLPLADHQRDGTFLVYRRRMEKGVNQKTGESVSYVRRRIEQMEGNVLQLYQDGTLLPPDLDKKEILLLAQQHEKHDADECCKEVF